MMISYRVHTGETAGMAVVSEPYVQLYEDVHADPSYEGNPLFSRDAYLERASAQAQTPGFVTVSAEDGSDLVGYTYGFTMEAGRWWRGALKPPPDEVLKETKLAVIELMVRDDHRGSGVGRQLLAKLLRNRDERYATLTARPVAAAHRMYLRWGWRVVGQSQPASDAPAMDIMLIDLGVS
ncbi:GNAT family N-acetyltransferase [Nonomuraea insulae]|uniref:GNAT family N-acetyltransferase n=1 Tax=Nonomuraea insulae TaxID=1616787 RepID=A0ABW1CRV3_9ACTN